MAKAAKKSAKPKRAAAPVAAAAAGLIDTETAARLCECTSAWVRKLTRDGWIKAKGRDQYLVVDVVQGMLRYMRDEARKSTKSEAAKKVHDVRAKEIELRIAKEEDRLIDIDDVDAVIAEVFAVQRSEFSGIGAACTRDLVLRAEIDRRVNDAINRAKRKLEEARRVAFNGADGGALDAEDTDA